MNPWLAALLAVTALRLAVAAAMPLAPDEAYYWVWSRILQGGYLDHPPMIAVFIRAGTLVAGDDAFGVRLMGPLAIALASLALADAANRLFPDRRPGVWAAALFNATLLVGAGGILATPDLPLLVFWTLALWAAARLHASQDGRWWLAFGLLAGLALASKYTAVLLGAGAVAWLVACRGAWRWWWDWRLYAGGAIAMVAFAPVVAWNAGHGWVSFAKQGGRVAAGAGFTPRFLGELLAGQVGLATPIVFVLCVTGVAGAALAWWRRGDTPAGLLVAMVVPGAALFLWQAMGSRVQGNWPGILYPAACIAAAAFTRRRVLRWRGPAVGLGLVLALAGYLQAMFQLVPLPRRMDPTLAQLGGWDALAAAVEAERRRIGADFVVAEEYGLAGQLALRLPPGVKLAGLEQRRWTFFDLPPPPATGTGLLVQSTRRDSEPEWTGAVPLGTEVERSRGAQVAERYRLFRVEPRQDLPAALLPRPGGT
ncbi:ArnT family glycosyltransferase [Falsiroseomonas sp. HW251]|uniref:ArnT family glycosyltransferase n=1 Tax=Falsiroseomonas sp. HW251 TaxID=3390998 RepID=UPI003D3149E0